MKFLSLFLSLCLILTLNTQHAKASMCSQLLTDSALAPAAGILKLNESESKVINAGDLLLSVFEAIKKAPNNSRIKIFTNSLKYDGVGSMITLLSIAESGKSRGLKFEFFVDEAIDSSRHYDLLAERSSNTVRYRSEALKENTERVTSVVIESGEQTRVIRFDGELSSMDLKDASRKRPLQVRYMGRTFLRASPFKESVLTKTLLSEAERASVNKSIESIGKQYDHIHKSELERMNESDVLTLSAKAFDLALQLYVHKFGKSPSTDMSSLQILDYTLNN